MEQEGLIWTFRYEKDKHVLVISDSNFMFRDLPTLGEVEYYAESAASERDGIERWDEAFSFRVGKVTYRDFNSERPWSKLMLVEAHANGLTHARVNDTERYEHQSLYDDFDNGGRYVRYAMEAEEAQARRFTGTGYASGMTTIGRFTLANHRTSTYNGKRFAILHVRHEAVNDYTQQVARLPYRNSFTCLPTDIPFRPERRTPKPSMQGTQTAIVVGPPGEEIYTDGSCVKVHFHWDRRGKMDGTDSMWVRVSQPWAGKGWGGSAIPRIGQEVVIAHDQGDPDMPLIIGRVFNGGAANPYHNTAGQTMGIRSQTHKGKGFNELRFSDVNGAQEVFLHAQKDMNTVIKDNETHTVEAGARSISVLKGDESKHVAQGSLSEKIAKARFTTANTVGVQALAGDAGPGKQSYQATDEIEHRVGAKRRDAEAGQHQAFAWCVEHLDQPKRYFSRRPGDSLESRAVCDTRAGDGDRVGQPTGDHCCGTCCRLIRKFAKLHGRSRLPQRHNRWRNLRTRFMSQAPPRRVGRTLPTIRRRWLSTICVPPISKLLEAISAPKPTRPTQPCLAIA